MANFNLVVLKIFIWKMRNANSNINEKWQDPMATPKFNNESLIMGNQKLMEIINITSMGVFC